MEQKTIETVESLKAKFAPVENSYQVHKSKMSSMDKLALFATAHIGSMGFFFALFIFNAIWISWNVFAPRELVFDAGFSFLVLLFINNIMQILFMPLIMVGQNLQGHYAELRAKHDFDTNVKAEKEIETILLHLEKQDEMMRGILQKIEKLEKL
ncbi:MAG: DUF1003 domain-containing protein [Candidatus Parcubacteria bacterium]|nr:DUF1003 domain-containing protein [Candidatus Parcubacteria bacterium]